MGFHSAPPRPDLLEFGSTQKFKAQDVPLRMSKPSLMADSKDMHRCHLTAAAYSAHLLVDQRAVWLTKLSTGWSQVRDLSGVLANESTALQGALIVWAPFFWNPSTGQSYLS